MRRQHPNGEPERRCSRRTGGNLRTKGSAMPATETLDAADGAEVLVRRWANEVCQAPSVSAGDLARALRLDLGEARRLGRQRIFPALNGASRLEFVLGADAETVLFIEVATTPAVTVA